MFEFLARRLSKQSSAASRARRRQAALLLEVLEPRTVMSASAGADEITAQGVSTQALPDGAGNSTAKARNIGELGDVAAYSDYIGAGDSSDYYRFTVRGVTNVTFRLNGLTDDANLQLLDSKGRLLLESFEVGTTPELINHQLGKGTYFIRVTPVGGAATSYTFQYSTVKDIAGDQLKSAMNFGKLGVTPIVMGEAVGGIDRRDMYKFTINAPSDVPISLTGMNQDLDLRLYNHRGLLVETSARGGASDEEIVRTLGKGTFFVEVRSFYGSISGYTLTIGEDVAEPDPDPEDPDVEPFPEVPDYGGANDWNLNAINAPEVWAQGYTGTGVVVAVVDSGVDWTHSDLNDNIWRNTNEIVGNGVDDDNNGYVDDYVGWDFVYGDNNPDDVDGHGTHVAGSVAAERNGFGATGVAYGAQIMAVRVLGDDGNGYLEDVAAGIRYAVDNGADVINLSLGGDAPPAIIQRALQYAWDNGVFVVAASGNEYAAVPGYPARYSSTMKNLLSVGAYDDDYELADFSNKVGRSRAIQVDAPGVNVYSTLPGTYGYLSGTSMATPHVAGLAALVIQALRVSFDETPDPILVRRIITATAEMEILSSDSIGGVNAAYAVAAALDPEALFGLSRSSASPVATATTFGNGGTNRVSKADAHDGFSRLMAQTLGETPIASAATFFVDAIATPSIGRGESIEGAFARLDREFGANRPGESIAARRLASTADAQDEWFAGDDKLDAAFAVIGRSL